MEWIESLLRPTHSRWLWWLSSQDVVCHGHDSKSSSSACLLIDKMRFAGWLCAIRCKITSVSSIRDATDDDDDEDSVAISAATYNYPVRFLSLYTFRLSFPPSNNPPSRTVATQVGNQPLRAMATKWLVLSILPKVDVCPRDPLSHVSPVTSHT